MAFPLTGDQAAQLKKQMRTVPDFPKKGIKFKDLATLLIDPDAMKLIYESLAERCALLKPDYLVLLEARGFLVGTPLGLLLHKGVLLLRKPGKLPGKLVDFKYDLEYGSDTLTVQVDLGVPEGSRVLIIDDLLATGGSAAAAAHLMQKIGLNVVGAGFISELTSLPGRAKLAALDSQMDVFSLLQFDSNME